MVLAIHIQKQIFSLSIGLIPDTGICIGATLVIMVELFGFESTACHDIVDVHQPL